MITRALFLLGVLVVNAVAASAEPPAPVTVSPGSPTEVVQVGDRCPTFSWGSLPQTSSLLLAVYRVDETAAEQIRVALTQDLPSSASSWTPPLHSCLDAGATYAWRVGAATGDGEPAWSAPAWFEVPGLGTGQPEVVTTGVGELPKGIVDLGTASASVPATGSGATAAVTAPSAGAVRALASYFSVGSGGTVTAGPVTATSFTGDGSGLTSLQPGAIAGLTAGGITFGAGGAGGLTQDAPNLFWDDAANRLQLAGNLRLAATASGGTEGVLEVAGARFLHTFGTDDTFLGVNAGNFTMSGTENTAVGSYALTTNSSGEDNTAVGASALKLNTSGLQNAAFGSQALANNTTGRNNTAVGSGALANNTTIYGSTAVGRNALMNQSFDPGVDWWQSQNTAVGEEALFTNNPTSADPMDGFANTAIGFKTLRNNATGSRNVALGSNALFSNTVGEGNVALGHTAMRSNTTASYNVAVGTWALYTQSYDNSGGRYDTENTAIGYIALHANQPTGTDNGVKNTAVGSQSMHHNTIGSDNTAIGRMSLANNTTANFNVAVGSNALENQSYANGDAAYDAANTAVGVSALQSNQPTSTTTGIYNTAIGAAALNQNTIGSNNTALGIMAGFNLTTGDYNIHIGNQGIAAEGNTIRIGDSNQTRAFVAGIHGVTPAGDGPLTVVVDSNGQLGTAASSSSVLSVFGRTGTVVPATSDYDAAQIDNTPAGGIAAADVQAAINELDTEKAATEHTHAASQITGVIGVSQGGTGTSTGSIAAAGAVTIAAGGADQNVTVTPSGTGSVSLAARVTILSNGHVHVAGTAPTIGSCGTGSSVATGSTDVAGHVVVDDDVCVINFASAWAHPPFCVIAKTQNEVGYTAKVETTTTTMTVTQGPNDDFNYVCIGY